MKEQADEATKVYFLAVLQRQEKLYKVMRLVDRQPPDGTNVDIR